MKTYSAGIRIAHLSDVHFGKICRDLSQFLSKRWIGNLNLILSRQHTYETKHLWRLPNLFHSLEVDYVFITGDLSSTSSDVEFSEGKRFVYAFKEKELPTFFVPGNHDCYIKSVEKYKRFYSFFNSEDLKEKRVECISLKKGWWYLGLDCAVASPPFCSYGYFLKKTEQYLREALGKIPQEDSVIIGNHFPLFSTGRPFHDLKKAKDLQEVVNSFRQVKLYLHGHDHGHAVTDRQDEGFPLVLNSGSCSLRSSGSFYLVDLFERECLVQRQIFQKKKDGWITDWQKHFSLKR
jgi:3',5'-cyclic AMP phosphodiesterase CpdA